MPKRKRMSIAQTISSMIDKSSRFVATSKVHRPTREIRQDMRALRASM